VSEIELRRSRFAELDPATLYGLLRLRVNVFVVEQQCPYPELDGRDVEPDTVHFWYERDNRPLTYLRLLTEPDGVGPGGVEPDGSGSGGTRIGRVCTAAEARGTGLAGRLLDAALEVVGDRPCALHAQSHLTGFYARHGFRPVGPEFLDDGIPHTPMARPAS
jgi:ElaA protein